MCLHRVSDGTADPAWALGVSCDRAAYRMHERWVFGCLGVHRCIHTHVECTHGMCKMYVECATVECH